MGENWEVLGKAVRDTRTAHGKTQAWLSEAAGVSRATVQKLERGEAVRVTTLVKIERELNWASGSSQAMLNGASGPIEITPAGPTGGFRARIPDGELDQAITNAMVATVDTMTAAEIREVAAKVVDELKQRGVL